MLHAPAYFVILLNNYNVSAGRRNKSQDELSALVEVMTPEAHPIGSAVGE